VGLRAVTEPRDAVEIADFLTWKPPVAPFSVCITNPPYSIAEEVTRKCQVIAEITVLLLRVNFLASGERAEWLKAWTPDVYVIPNRPSFRGKGTDSTEYAWFVFDRRRRTGAGQLSILATTPKEIRKAEKERRLTGVQEEERASPPPSDNL
jgi:hypothetical protein